MPRAYRFIQEFECLGAECEDTCCKGWGMQLDPERKSLYEQEAPELLDAVTSGEADLIMKRDPETDYCVKFDNGLCSVHNTYGTKFLGDACHFFPRITRAFGEQQLMAGALSCPEIARLTLLRDNAFELEDMEVERLPYSLKDYLPEGASEADTTKVITALITMAGDKSISPERAIARLIAIAPSLENTALHTWQDGINMLITMADNMLPAPEPNPHDPYYILQTLAALMHASKKTARPRLDATFAAMQQSLGMTIDKDTLDVMLNVGEEHKPQALYAAWQQNAAKTMTPFLRRWVQTQLAMSSFPYAGFGDSLKDRVTIIAVRYATVKLGLMAHMQEDGTPPDDAAAITVVQSLARFMDHLADPELSMRLYSDAGWTKPARLRALIGDA